MKMIGAPNQVSSSIGIFPLPSRGGGGVGGGGGGGTGLINIEIGTDTFGFGFRGDPGAFPTSTADNLNPTPPGVGGVALLQLSQFSSGIWQLRLQPAVIANSGFETITITTPALGDVVLTRSAATYTANSFGSSLWSFPSTAIRWHGLANSTAVTATFA